MNIANLRGMRYPDEYIIRMFYKECLHKRATGRVLELGSGSGNNLIHFAAYGWSVTGIDNDPACISDSFHNLSLSGFNPELFEHDLSIGLPSNLMGKYDCLLIPSMLYYIPREAAWACMHQARALLPPGSIVYLRMRLPDDYRWGRGIDAGLGAWKLDFAWTGELGALNVFWDEHELLDLFFYSLGILPKNLTRLRVSYENLQNGKLIRNSDIVLWGNLP